MAVSQAKGRPIAPDVLGILDQVDAIFMDDFNSEGARSLKGAAATQQYYLAAAEGHWRQVCAACVSRLYDPAHLPAMGLLHTLSPPGLSTPQQPEARPEEHPRCMSITWHSHSHPGLFTLSTSNVPEFRHHQ